MKHMAYVLLAALTTIQPSLAAEHAWDGSYEFVSAGSSDVASAIEQAVATMSFIKRPIARGRLKQTNPSYQRVSITRAGNQMTITFDARKPVTAPTDGSFVRWKREDGEEFEVAIQLRSSELAQTFRADDGQRVNTYRMPTPNELHMDVLLTSEQLPAPIKYTLRYRRVP